MSVWLPFGAALVYVALLFAVAFWTERRADSPALSRRWPAIYALSLGVYCTAWTFFGGVGTAAREGWAYLPIYLGPALVFLFASGFLVRLAETAKRENSTSIADFIAARYGKSRSVAVLVTALALMGAIPYIALQLRSVGSSLAALTAPTAELTGPHEAPDGTVFLIALTLATFGIMFGARRFDAAGRNRGLVVAMAVESAVKLAAFAAVGAFALALIGGLDPQARAAADARFAALFSAQALEPQFLTITLLAMGAIVCLPRQFYIGVLEAVRPEHVRQARWPFTAYLAATALIVAPITYAGLALAPPGANADLLVVSLPLAAGAEWLALIAFVGGFSAATSMAIAATVALSIMVSNDLIAPFLLSGGRIAPGADMGRLLLLARRATILGIMLAAYAYSRAVEQSATLAAIGLLAFAAVIQFAPALIGGLYWPKGNARGARAGLAAGMAFWIYTLFAPSYLGQDGIAALGLTVAFGGLLDPHALLGLSGLDPLTHGVLWSLGANVALYVGVSLARPQRDILAPTRTSGALRFGAAATLGDLRGLTERFVGPRTAADEFEHYAFERGRTFRSGDPIDGGAARLAERLIAGVIGAPSARVIVASSLSGAALDVADVVRLLDETSQELQFSRELLAATMDNISQGVSVVDKDLKLIAWNAAYLAMFEFPPGFIRVGRPIADVIRYNAERGECGPGEVEDHVARRLASYRRGQPHVFERRRPNGSVLKTMGNPMPGGGYVATFTDITAEKLAQAELEQAKGRLEERVVERTADLSREVERSRRLAEELAAAKAAAEAATLSKTKFLAAASHDLLQPLHAARLFTAALEGTLADADAETQRLARNIDRSIASADQLLRALLDISRLDAGGYKPIPTRFPIGDLLEELATEFRPLAHARGLRLLCRTTCDCMVLCDRVLLRQVLQNFLSNAVRYTARGGVLLGCRWRRDGVRVEVWDTGPGIPADKLGVIFREFQRLAPTGGEPGAGLGLAIAERAAALIEGRLDVRSRLGKGSAFAVTVARAGGACETSPAAEATAPALNPSPAGLKVLCVDNDPAILAGLSAMLTGWGVSAETAPGYAEALSLMRGAPFDAALIDYQLDGPETGIDVLAALRKRSPNAEAALVTADPSPEVAARAAALGARVLPKPLDPAVLRAALARVEGRASG